MFAVVIYSVAPCTTPGLPWSKGIGGSDYARQVGGLYWRWARGLVQPPSAAFVENSVFLNGSFNPHSMVILSCVEGWNKNVSFSKARLRWFPVLPVSNRTAISSNWKILITWMVQATLNVRQCRMTVLALPKVVNGADMKECVSKGQTW